MRDSVLTMISMTYDEPSETFPSLLRAMRFAGARNEPDLAPVPPRPDERQCGVSRRTLRGSLPLAETKRSLRQGQGRFRGRVAAPQNDVSGATQSRKRLRESAAKHLESLTRVNLCAPTALYDWSKLALGPASANALPTSSPRSSIEVCSRTERSSPFACRSACSGERATLTVTFDSTSGCR
jgi:hypothetical protein